MLLERHVYNIRLPASTWPHLVLSKLTRSDTQWKWWFVQIICPRPVLNSQMTCRLYWNTRVFQPWFVRENIFAMYKWRQFPMPLLKQSSGVYPGVLSVKSVLSQKSPRGLTFVSAYNPSWAFPKEHGTFKRVIPKTHLSSPHQRVCYSGEWSRIPQYKVLTGSLYTRPRSWPVRSSDTASHRWKSVWPLTSMPEVFN